MITSGGVFFASNSRSVSFHMPYLVEVSARQLFFPKLCACCAGSPDGIFQAMAIRTKGVRVVRTDTRWWDVPYCRACLRHIEYLNRSKRWWNRAILLLVLSVGWISVSLFFPKDIVNLTEYTPWGSIVFALAAVSYFLGIRYHRRAMRATCATCACVEEAVVYAGWYGSIHTFLFDNREFADAIIRANEKKVVD